MMQYRVFRVPAGGCADTEEAVNRFLRGVRVLRVDRQFVPDGQGAFWSLCVEYLESPKARAAAAGDRKDYKEELAPADFALFVKLRELRKALAADEGVPVYAVCTNEHLAALAQRRPGSATALRQIDGIGQAKAEKYGGPLLAAIAAHSQEVQEGNGAAGGPPV